MQAEQAEIPSVESEYICWVVEACIDCRWVEGSKSPRQRSDKNLRKQSSFPQVFAAPIFRAIELGEVGLRFTDTGVPVADLVPILESP